MTWNLSVSSKFFVKFSSENLGRRSRRSSGANSTRDRNLRMGCIDDSYQHLPVVHPNLNNEKVRLLTFHLAVRVPAAVRNNFDSNGLNSICASIIFSPIPFTAFARLNVSILHSHRPIHFIWPPSMNSRRVSSTTSMGTVDLQPDW